VEGDAQHLLFTDATYDRVLLNFGLLHLSRPEKSCAEAFRVLKAGGKFGFTVWASPPENPGAKIVRDALDAEADLTIELPPGAHRWSACASISREHEGHCARDRGRCPAPCLCRRVLNSDGRASRHDRKTLIGLRHRCCTEMSEPSPHPPETERDPERVRAMFE